MSETPVKKFKVTLISFLNRLDQWIAGPHPSLADVGKFRQARLLAYLSIVYALTNLIGAFATIAQIGFQPIIYILLVLFLITVLSYALSRTRLYFVGAITLIVAQSISGFVLLFTSTSGAFSGVLSSMIPSLIIATVYLPVSWVVILTVVDSIGIGFIPIFNPSMDQTFAIETIGFFFTIGLLSIVVMVFRNRLESERIREVRTINKELEESKHGLEDRVRERTTELAQRSQELELANTKAVRRAAQFEAIAQVTRATASLQNLHETLSRIAEAISKQFGYYHVGIFLIDENKQYAVLTASNSTGGQKMLSKGHRLEVGKVGIVGYVTGTGEARIALDTGQDAVYFNNPDLPNTHSEIALPIHSGKQTIGALDVQSVEPNAFMDEDIETLGILADQVSLAIENTHLFEQTQRALAESELLNRQYLRQEWSRLPKEQKLAGFRYNISGSAPLEDPIEIPDVNNVLKKGELLQRPAKDGQPAQLTIPVQVRGETIGVLNVQSSEVERWSQDQVEIATAVAERVALSAENARLFAETSRRAEREQKVSQITTNIRSYTDPQTMLQAALEELKQALGATEINIRPYTQSSKQPASESGSSRKRAPKKTEK